MPGHRPWEQDEINLVALMYAHGADVDQIMAKMELAGYDRSRTSVANAKTQRADVKDRIRYYREHLGLNGLEPDHPELRELERKTTVQDQLINDLRKKLKEADKRAHIVDAVVEEVREAVEPFREPPLMPTKAPATPEQTPVSMVSILSDIHADEVIHPDQTWGFEDFDFEVCQVRMERWTQLQIDYLTKHLPQYSFGELWVLSLGDLLHGDIHGHGPKNYFGSTPKAAIATGDLIADSLMAIHTQTGIPIRVVGVSGNHPRRSVRKDYEGPQDNFDYVCLVQAASRLRDIYGIDIVLPNAWTAFVEIRGRLWCLNHGDDVKGFAGHPWYGFSRKNARIQALVSQKDWMVDYYVYGHYHTPAMVAESSHSSWHNGSFSVTDPYAIEKVNAGNTPQQWSFVVDDARGILQALPLYVQDLEQEHALRNGAYRPWLGATTGLDLVSPETSGTMEFQVIRSE